MDLQHAGLSERRSCALVGISRSAFHYAPQSTDEAAILKLLSAYALQEPRAGYRRAHQHLRTEHALTINRKRVQRLWQKAKLQVPGRKRRRRRRITRDRAVPLQASHPRHVISYDFLEDSTADGRPLRILTIIDEFTRECLAIKVARSFTAADVIRVLAQVFAAAGNPEFIRSDNGPEFIAYGLCFWIYQQNIDTHHIDPGSPWQNGFVESFHARFRDECLNLETFISVVEAQVIVERWRHKYNTKRPHSSLGNLSPEAFHALWRAGQA
jgi:transposase InsO family protein